MPMESYDTRALREGACMCEVVKKLKGISCLLYALTYQSDEGTFMWQEEAMELIDNNLKQCIKEIEDKE